jgi:hypothetical protein
MEFLPLQKGVPERERGGGILERMENSKALENSKAVKSLFLVRQLQQYILRASCAQFILPLQREKFLFMHTNHI